MTDPTDDQAQLAYEVDADGAVGAYLDAEVAYRSAVQRTAKARDQLAATFAPLRAADREAEAAERRLLEVDQAEAAAGEWSEALQQQRDAAVRAGRDRDASRGRGPAAWAAKARLANVGADRAVHAERVAALQAKATEAAERVGTMDPARWAEERARASAVLEQHAERRARLVAEEARRSPEVRAWLVEAQAAQVEVERRREAAAAELARRGIDADRLQEAMLRINHGAGAERSSDPETERALAAWRERQGYVQRAGELDAEREERRGPEREGPQAER